MTLIFFDMKESSVTESLAFLSCNITKIVGVCVDKELKDVIMSKEQLNTENTFYGPYWPDPAAVATDCC